MVKANCFIIVVFGAGMALLINGQSVYAHGEFKKPPKLTPISEGHMPPCNKKFEGVMLYNNAYDSNSGSGLLYGCLKKGREQPRWYSYNLTHRNIGSKSAKPLSTVDVKGLKPPKLKQPILDCNHIEKGTLFYNDDYNSNDGQGLFYAYMEQDGSQFLSLETKHREISGHDNQYRASEFEGRLPLIKKSDVPLCDFKHEGTLIYNDDYAKNTGRFYICIRKGEKEPRWHSIDMKNRGIQ